MKICKEKLRGQALVQEETRGRIEEDKGQGRHGDGGKKRKEQNFPKSPSLLLLSSAQDAEIAIRSLWEQIGC